MYIFVYPQSENGLYKLYARLEATLLPFALNVQTGITHQQGQRGKRNK